MRKDHPLAKQKSIDLQDIKKYNVVRIEKNSITLPLFNETFEEFKFHSNVEFKNADWEFLKHYVRSGIGIAVVSTICVDDYDPDLTYKKLDKYFPTMDYQIVVKKGGYLNETVKDFINLIDKTAINQ